ncbi:MAG: hypothetical protein ACE5H1_07580 [Thermodesulfobacteriota bacterium]
MQRKSTYLSGEIFSACDVAVHIPKLPVRILVEQAWVHRNAVNRSERRRQQGYGKQVQFGVTQIVTGKKSAEGIIGDLIAEGQNMK